MSTTDTERYVRITLLTFDGGLWIGKKILFREVDRTPAPTTLDALLLSKKSMMTKKRNENKITDRQYETLFPSSNDDTDVDEWDLSLLIKTVKLLFVLPSQDAHDLSQILKIRNEVVCHAKQPSIREQEYKTYWTKLSDCIYNLASAFDERTKGYASELVRNLSQGPLDLQSSIDKVGQLCRNDDQKEHILASMAQLERRIETRFDEVAAGVSGMDRKLDDVLSRLLQISKTAEEDQCRIELPKLNGEVCLSGKKEDVSLAKDILLKVTKCAIARAKDQSDDKDLRNAVQQFLDDIESKGGCAESAESGSIVLKIRCNTLSGLINMLDLFRIHGCRYRLVGIENALNALLQDDLKVELVLSEDAIDNIQAWIDINLPKVPGAISDDSEPEYKRNITLGIRCDTAEAAVDVMRYFQSGDSANRLNTIAETMSQALGDQVKIEAVPDIEGFSRALSSSTALVASQRSESDKRVEGQSVQPPEEVPGPPEEVPKTKEVPAPPEEVPAPPEEVQVPTPAEKTEAPSKYTEKAAPPTTTEGAYDDCLRTSGSDVKTESPPTSTDDHVVHELDLNGYHGNMNAEEMREAVLETRSSLTKLTVGRVDLSSLGDQLCDVISLDRLEDLALRSLTLSHEQYHMLGGSLQRSPRLRKLILCNISCEIHGNRNGCVDLDLTGLPRLQDIKIAVLPVSQVDLNTESLLRCDIQLYDNIAGQTSALQNLPSAGNLLHLTCVDLGDVAAVNQLIKVLPKLEELQKLELFQIDFSSVTDFRITAKLVSVELHYCKFDFVGIECLLDQLNLSQKRVEIKLNNITIRGEEDLLSKIRDSPDTDVTTDRGVVYREGEWKVGMFNFYTRKTAM